MLKLALIIFSSFLVLSLRVNAEAMLEIKTPGVEKVEVFARSNFSDEPVKVGETPLEENLQSFIQRFSKVNIVVVELVKKGYKKKSFVLMKGSDFDIKLSIPMEAESEISKIQEIDLMIAELFKVQNLIRNQDFGTSLTRLNKLSDSFYEFSIIPELKGYIFYMKKDVDSALANFRQAFSLNSKNVDAYKMKVYLEDKLGIKANEN